MNSRIDQGQPASIKSTTTESARIQQLEETCASLRSQLEETRRNLVQANKMSIIGQMIAMVAHDLNNPLNGVLGYAQLIMKRTADEQTRSGLRKIEHEAHRASKIVQTLLQFVREHPPERRIVRLNEIISSMAGLRAHYQLMEQIELTLDLDPDLPETIAEPHQIGQVILNLIINAEQAMTGASMSGSIRVTTGIASSGDHPVIRIRIRDSGPGIPPDAVDRIFDPFFTTKPGGQGTGLGLAICRQIIADHGGALTVDSRPGGGATFIIDLPVVEEDREISDMPDAGEQTPAPIPACRGLVIDDEIVVREFVGETLTSEGHQMDTAANGREAFDALKKNQYDFIVCDLKMPEVNGQTFYDVVKNFNDRLSRKSIFITGDTANLDTESFFEKAGNYYLYKPFHLNDLIAIVNRVIMEQR